MQKLNTNQAKTYLSQLKNPVGVSFDECVGDSNKQSAKSKIRQQTNALIDQAAAERQRILITIGD